MWEEIKKQFESGRSAGAIARTNLAKQHKITALKIKERAISENWIPTGGFTSQQEIFISNYVTGKTAKESAKIAKYSSVEKQGSRLLSDPIIKAEIRKRIDENYFSQVEQLRKKTLDRCEMFLDLDIKNVVDLKTGQLKPGIEKTENTKLIKSYELVKGKNGSSRMRVALHDPQKAIDQTLTVIREARRETAVQSNTELYEKFKELSELSKKDGFSLVDLIQWLGNSSNLLRGEFFAFTRLADVSRLFGELSEKNTSLELNRSNVIKIEQFQELLTEIIGIARKIFSDDPQKFAQFCDTVKACTENVVFSD